MKLRLWLSYLFIATFSSVVYGQETGSNLVAECYNHPMYIGLEFNYNVVAIKTSTAGVVEYNAPGYRMLWGTHLNNLISFQTAMHYIGKASSSIIKGSSSAQDVEGSAMEVAILLHVPVPLGGMVMPYMKIGGEFWVATYSDATATPVVKEQLAGGHPLYGFGMDMVMSEVFSIAFEVEKSLNSMLSYTTSSLRGKWKF